MKTIFTLLCSTILLFAGGNRHHVSRTVEAGSSIQLSINVENPQGKEVFVHYRTKITDDYKTLRLSQQGYDFRKKIDIPKDDYHQLEYYFSIRDRRSRQIVTEPKANPQSHPYVSKIVRYSQNYDVQYEILAPYDGEEVQQEDFMIALSILKVSSGINLSLTQVLMDGVNLTQFAELDEEIITFVPINRLKKGTHNIEVRFFNNSNEVAKSIEWSCKIEGDGEEKGFLASSSSGKFASLYGSVNLDTRSESYGAPDSTTATSSYNVTVTNANLNGNLGPIDFNAYASVSTDEVDNQQSINRIGANARMDLFWGMYIRGQFGDFTPDYNEYMLNSENMRGFDIGLMTGLFNFEFAKGQNRKEILTATDSVNSSYEREFIAGRFSIGDKAEGFSLGVNVLKSTDQPIENSDSLMNINPQENLVFGADFQLGFAQNRVKLKVGALGSVLMDDVSGGAIPYEDLQTLLPDIASTVSESQYQTINDVITFAGIPSLGYMIFGSFDFNYWNQLINLTYKNIDAGFTTHGNPFIQNDINDISYSHTMRLFDNAVYLRGTYHTSDDNVAKDESLPRSSNDDFSLGADWYPHSDLPTINLNFSNNDQKTKTLTGDTLQSDFQNKSFNVGISKGFSFLGFDPTFNLILGNTDGVSTIDDTLNTKTNSLIINGAMNLNVLPIRVFAEFASDKTESLQSTIDKVAIKLQGTYELITTEALTVSATGQFYNSSSDQTDHFDATNSLKTSETEVEFGGNMGYRISDSMSLSSYLRFRTVSISASTDYSNSYFTFGAGLNF